MKASLYSNRLENIYNQISSRSINSFIIKSEYNSIKNSVGTISDVYITETDLYDKYSKDYSFRKKIKKEAGIKSISDFLIGMKNKVNVVDKNDVIMKVKARNEIEKNRSKLEKITQELKIKYKNKPITRNNKNLRVDKKINNQKIVNKNKRVKFSDFEKKFNNRTDHNFSNFRKYFSTNKYPRPKSQTEDDLITAASSTGNSKYKFFSPMRTNGIADSIPETELNTTDEDNGDTSSKILNPTSKNGITPFSNLNLVKIVNFEDEELKNYDQIKFNRNLNKISEEGSPNSKNEEKFFKSKTFSSPVIMQDQQQHENRKMLFPKRRNSVLENVLSNANKSQQKEFLDSPRMKILFSSNINPINERNKNTTTFTALKTADTNNLNVNKDSFFKIRQTKNKNSTKSFSNFNRLRIDSSRTAKSTGNLNNKIKSLDNNERKPHFTSSIALNKFLIRDFGIGESNDPLGNSKKKLDLTTNMYDYIEGKKIQKMNKIIKDYETDKYGGIISELKKSKKDDDDDESLVEEEDNFYSQGNDKIIKEYKILRQKENLKIKENSKKMIEMLENISDSSYEEIETLDKMVILKSNLINQKNLDRLVRVRDIVYKKIDKQNDFLGFQNLEKFKENRRESDNQLMLILKKLNPPSFLKTKFKKTTIDKFKVVNGRYFGCKV